MLLYLSITLILGILVSSLVYLREHSPLRDFRKPRKYPGIETRRLSTAYNTFSMIENRREWELKAKMSSR
jgi:hypothetical protein